MEKNKLITLLAVIVVLAVIIVIAARWSATGASASRESAFRVEANKVLKASKKAYKDYNSGKIEIKNDLYSCKNETIVCFTVEELVRLGYYEDENSNYSGKVIIDNVDYEMYLQKNNEFSINGLKNVDYTKGGEVLVGGFVTDNNQTSCICE